MVEQNNLGIEGLSHDVMIDSDIVVGFFKELNTQTYCKAAFRPYENRIEILADYDLVF